MQPLDCRKKKLHLEHLKKSYIKIKGLMIIGPRKPINIQ